MNLLSAARGGRILCGMGKAYHKLRSERHGLLDLGEDEQLPERIVQARERAGQYIVQQPDGRFGPEQLSSVLRQTARDCGELDGDVVVFRMDMPAGLPPLPEGYGYKGGAARFALAQLLFGEQQAFTPRDLDLVRFGERWSEQDTEVSRKFMGRDFERGNGVELASGEKQYFRSRDLSINEVAVIGGLIRCTIPCLLDTLGWILRPCYYRPGSLHREASLRGRTLLKMLRLHAEAIELGQWWGIAGVPGAVEIGDFELALELNKALFRGRAAAERLATYCIDGELFPARAGQGLADVIAELCLGLYDGLGFFAEASSELRREVETRLAGSRATRYAR